MGGEFWMTLSGDYCMTADTDPYIGRRVWTRLRGDRLSIHVGRTTLAQYPLDYEPRT